ncbi:hypothetical protein LBMAG42_51430 [Deltaproteobacteria bacterium]|nr:hypothetical protein LBMAG42_51430 [Deltaproteobacteria bacterium]
MSRIACLLGVCLVGCETASEPGALEATGSLAAAMPTVLEITWSGAAEGAAIYAEWGSDDTYGQRVRLGAGREGAGVLVGLHPNAKVHWRVATDEGATSTDATVEAGSAPVDLPELSVSNVGDTTGGLVLTSTLDGVEGYAVAYDHEGFPVWWVASGEEGPFTDVYPSPDGRGVIYQTTDPKLIEDIANVTFRAWNGEVISTTRTPNGHHDFVVLPDGSYGFCMIDVREAEIAGETFTVVGDAIGEIPAGGDPETDVRTVWSSWDAFTMRATPAADTHFYPFGLDWTHCNGLAYEPEVGKYLVSMYELGSVTQVDAATGTTDWILGGEDGTLSIPAGETFNVAHSPEPVAGGLRLFNNRATEETPPHSRVLEYQIDEAAGSAALVESIALNGEYFSFILGDSNALPDEHLLVSWGSLGMLTELDADREVVWQGELPLGQVVGFTSDVQVPGQAPE